MIDVDYFKSINDTYGHDAGDEVLKQLASTLRGHNPDRNTFTVCRWGGEEFLVLYIYNGPREDVVTEFETIRKKVENTSIPYDDKTIRITITAGLTFYRKGMSLDELLKEVDTLLYAGKEAGRNRVTHSKL